MNGREFDAIVTTRIPAICPACAHPDLEISSPEDYAARGLLFRVSCKRGGHCEWREKYLLRAKEVG